MGWPGWVGSLTGMNDQKMGICEIGAAYADETFGEVKTDHFFTKKIQKFPKILQRKLQKFYKKIINILQKKYKNVTTKLQLFRNLDMAFHLLIFFVMFCNTTNLWTTQNSDSKTQIEHAISSWVRKLF